MKQKYRTWMILLAAVMMSAAVTAQESTRRFSKSWPAGDVETLEITNKYGQVKISDNGGRQITIEVVVTVQGSENRAKSVLDDISVDFGTLGRKATAETKMASSFKSRNNFSIDYVVNIPSEKNLVITNKFGNVVLQNLTGKGKFDIGYGNLTAGQLSGGGTDGVVLNLAYGRADIESVKDARISLGYSRLYLKTAGSLTLESKYSTLESDNILTLKAESRYDTFNLRTIQNLEGDSRFTNYRIGTLGKRLKLVSGYGAIRVDHVPADFELIEINNSYAQIYLGLEPGAAYQMYASCEYCTVDFPQNDFSGNRMKENNKQTIDGKIAGGNRGQIRVISKYGNIKLVK